MCSKVVITIRDEGDYLAFTFEDSPEVQIPKEKIGLVFDQSLGSTMILRTGENPELSVNNLNVLQDKFQGIEIPVKTLKEAMIAT
jgi:hypothetical protein